MGLRLREHHQLAFQSHLVLVDLARNFAGQSTLLVVVKVIVVTEPQPLLSDLYVPYGFMLTEVD